MASDVEHLMASTGRRGLAARRERPMLTVRGRFENGRITLTQPPPVRDDCEVLVTFLDASGLIAVPEESYVALNREAARASCGLSDRECEVLGLLQQGLTNQEIALAMGIREGTVRNYTSALYAKLDVRNRLEAVTRGIEMGLLEGIG